MRARYYSPIFKRFINADVVAGSITNSITLNRYAYANGNPVSNIDPFGLEAGDVGSPTVLEAAYMAQHIYDATFSDAFKPLGDDFGDWMLESIYVNTEGLKIGIYSKVINGVKSYTIVNEGSSSCIDWANNFQQPLGLSDDMKDSIDYVEQFVESHSDAKITFVGHSKGGAEAAANAVATNKDAILFNPATVYLSAYGLKSKSYSADMTAYIVEGDILNLIFGFMSVPIDKCEYIGRDSFGDKLLSMISLAAVVEGVNDHSIKTVINELRK